MHFARLAPLTLLPHALGDFDFGTSSPLYFSHVRRGLGANFAEVERKGCLLPKQKVRIAFHQDDINPAQPYVWYNLEQQTSGFFNAKTALYKKRAIDLWDFSPRHCASANRSCFALSLSAADPSHLPGIWARAVGLPFAQRPTKEEARSIVARRTINALFFGALNHRRRRLCEQLGSSVECYSTLFGEKLHEKLINTKLVFFEPYYEKASLSTHRINQALARGVPVLTTRGYDEALDREYEALGVLFSRNKALAAEEVLALVDDPERLAEALQNTSRYVSRKRRRENEEALCQASERVYKAISI